MDGPERNLITRFAAGDTSLRDEAIRIHRLHLRLYGVRRDDAHFNFMSEVDNKCPDLMLRSRYRKQVLKSQNSR